MQVSNPYPLLVVHPKQRKRLTSSIIILGLICSIVSSIILFVPSPNDTARADTQLPSASDPQVYLNVSIPDLTAGGSTAGDCANCLLAPKTFAKAYFSQPTGNHITILDALWCGGPGPDTANSPAETLFRFLLTGPDEKLSGGTAASDLYPGGENPSRGPCTKLSDYTINLGTLTKSTVVGHESTPYTVILSAEDISPPGGLNAFKYQVSTDAGTAKIGYWDELSAVGSIGPTISCGLPPSSTDPGILAKYKPPTSPSSLYDLTRGPCASNNATFQSPFSAQNRVGRSNTYSDFSFTFAPPCDLDVAQETIYLRWSDDDQESPSQPERLNFTVQEADLGVDIVPTTYTSVGSPAPLFTYTPKTRVGQNHYREFGFTIKKGKHYRWNWNHVYRLNGIQMWMPFESVNYDQTCGNYDMKAFIKETGGTPAPTNGAVTGYLNAGQSYPIMAGLRNDGTVSSADPVYMEVQNSYQGSYVSSSPFMMFTSNATRSDYTNTSGISGCGNPQTPVCTSPHWFWQYGPLAAPTRNAAGTVVTTSGGRDGAPEHPDVDPAQTYPAVGPTFSFLVNSSTPDGTQLCFQTNVTRQNSQSLKNPDGSDQTWPSGMIKYQTAYSNSICWTVNNPSYPYVDTTKGDVHAGGGVETACSNDGYIQGNAKATGAGAEYIASASQVITNFSSALGRGGVFGANGFYGRICRPNLAPVAASYPAKSVTTIIPLTPISPGSLAPNIVNEYNNVLNLAPYRLFPGGGGFYLAGGTLSGRKTLFINGDLTITGNIVYSGVAVSGIGNLPSFGVIVTGNIYVDPGVTRIDGFYSAGNNTSSTGSFYSCQDSLITSLLTNVCKASKLTINGFIMGNQIILNRVTDGPGPVISEQVNLTGILYANTPPAFEGQVNSANNLPIFDGDRPPVY